MNKRVEYEDEHSRWVIDRVDGSGERLKMLRVVKGMANADREFDYVFWQSLGGDAISQATCELTELYLLNQGREDDLRLQRAVGGFQQRGRALPRRRRTRGKPVHRASLHEGS